MPEQIYTEAEVSALLARAARLQAVEAPSGRTGLTLAEIKAAAAAAGIDPRFVEQAASVATDHRQTTWTIPTGVGRSLVTKGALTDDRWRRMTTMFAAAFGGPGTSTVEGDRRTWTRGAVRVTADQTGDEVLLHAETGWAEELELPIPFMLVGAIATGVTGALALVSLEWMIGVVTLLAALAVAGGFAAYRRRMAARQAHHRDTFETTLDRCAALLQEGTATPANAGRTAEASGRIELPEAEPRSDPPAARTSQRPDHRVR